MHQRITRDAVAFGPFQRISVDISGKIISVFTKETPYRTALGLYLRIIVSGAVLFVQIRTINVIRFPITL